MKGTERILQAFRKVYLSRQAPEPSPYWQANVMREINRLAYEEETPWWDTLFWRLVPVLATILVFLSVAAIKTPLLPQELSSGLFQDPLMVSFISIFGV